ncbi:hypothetical protein VSDG_09528 [Cytospora chrysosperma]|uniref:Ent-kaurene synthase n=1 Tax=Cytospora chrysosperma TaxID=252740 RepID=A0A423VAF0_CYTCH|nr:hypothetical protein VSDG_09528 [Valsa sordida]
MTCAVYDTAWLSMIAKPADSCNWLFPSSFLRLLDLQNVDTGGWFEPDDMETDTILNTAAALLALCRHHGKPTGPSACASHSGDNLGDRITAASGFLRERLQELDLSRNTAMPVGFELLLPTLLDLLSREDIADVLSTGFPAREVLLDARRRKLARVDLATVLTGGRRSTILHSLEAFIGMIQFDHLRDHKVMGSMMASPASTAAYLMHCSTWDDESEQYLRHVVEAGSGRGSGGVPSAFPSTFFEISWVVATLIENGFSHEELGPKSLDSAKSILQHGLAEGSGLIGFAQSLESDADDTAKALTVLNLLGAPTSADPMIRKYSTGSHFRTYDGERDTSFTTNCNVLVALCQSTDVREHAREVAMVMRFLCRTWWQDRCAIRDKWNVSFYYTVMSVAQALTKALDLWIRELLPDLPMELLEDASVVLLQALVHLLQAQSEDGSWEGKQESTSYAVIALNTIGSLPLVHSVEPIMSQIELACRNGRSMLLKDISNLHSRPAEHLWIEKVTYGSRYISQAFTFAALKCSTWKDYHHHPCSATARVHSLLPAPIDQILQPAHFFKALPMFSTMPQWCMQACLIEGSLFKRRLRDTCLEVFPQKTNDKEKHLSFIPFTWTAGNNLHRGPLGADVILSMMIISALAYQIDEFVESEVAKLSMDSLVALQASVGILIADVEAENEDTNITVMNTNVTGVSNQHDTGNGAHDMKDLDDSSFEQTIESEARNLKDVHQNIHRTFRQFIRHFLATPYARSASGYNLAQLKFTIHDFLIAHLTQTEESRRLAELPNTKPQSIKTIQPARCSLFTWTRTTSGDHTAGPLAMSAFLCMLESLTRNGQDPLSSPQSRYVAQDVSRHLAALCRLYNDFGSVARDMAENNLNSINFPEFIQVFKLHCASPHARQPGPHAQHIKSSSGEQSTIEQAKRRLLEIAEYEQRCLQAAMVELRDLVDQNVYEALMVFCTTADMYGQMYVLKDLTPAVKRRVD